MTALRFVLCDVFTDNPLRGQPLAVFTRATGLSEARMQALARELNTSETAFVQPPTAGGHAKVRVFDSERELLDPGHSALGTAVVLGGALQAEEVRLEMHRGSVSVRLEREGARIVFGWVQELCPALARFQAVGNLQGALRLGRVLRESDVSEGATARVVVALDMDELVALAPDQQALARLEVDRVCVFAGRRGHYRARVFAPAESQFESALTPASAVAVAAHLVESEREPPDASLVIEAGAELERPSLVYARLAGTPGATGATGATGASAAGASAAGAIAVGGAAVVVGRGEIVLRD